MFVVWDAAEGGLSVLRRDVRLERRREILLEMAARSGARGRAGGLEEEDEGGMIGIDFVDLLTVDYKSC